MKYQYQLLCESDAAKLQNMLNELGRDNWRVHTLAVMPVVDQVGKPVPGPDHSMCVLVERPGNGGLR